MLTKQESKILKGCSILVMIWLHAFLYKKDVDSLYCFVYLGQNPLVTIIKNFCGICVFLYLFLGGYGLYITHTNKNLHCFRRVFTLYLNYWIVFVLIIPIGCILRPDIYPGSPTKIVLNLLAWDYSYNSSWWFLFPYILIILSSSLLFKILNIFTGTSIFILSYTINLMTSFLISRYGEQYLYNNLLLYIPLLYFHLLNAFFTGAIFAKYDLFKCVKNIVQNKPFVNWTSIAIIILIILLKGYITTSVINIFVVCLFFICIYLIDRPIWIDKVLYKLGEGSTNMWFVHAFICIYFFHDFTYSLKYPILVFLFVVICSFIIHLIINPIFIRCKYVVNKVC